MANTMGIDYAEDTREQIDDAGQTCTLGSASRNRIACVVSDERRTAQIEGESAIDVFEREVQILLDDIASIPEQNSTLVFDSTRYYVYDMQHDSVGESVLLFVRRNADGRIS